MDSIRAQETGPARDFNAEVWRLVRYIRRKTEWAEFRSGEVGALIGQVRSGQEGESYPAKTVDILLDEAEEQSRAARNRSRSVLTALDAFEAAWKTSQSEQC